MKERTTKTWRNKLDTNHQTKNIYSYSELWSSPMMSRVRYWWGNSPKGCQLIVAHNSKQNLWPGLHRPAFHEQHLSKSLWLPNWSRLCWSRMPLLFRDAALLLVLLGCCPASAADDCDLPLKVERHDLHQVGIRWRLDTEKEQPCFLRRSFVLFFHAGEGSLFHFFFFFCCFSSQLSDVRWVLVEAFTDYPAGQNILRSAGSSTVEMKHNGDNRTFLITEAIRAWVQEEEGPAEVWQRLQLGGGFVSAETEHAFSSDSTCRFPTPTRPTTAYIWSVQVRSGPLSTNGWFSFSERPSWQIGLSDKKTTPS